MRTRAAVAVATGALGLAAIAASATPAVATANESGSGLRAEKPTAADHWGKAAKRDGASARAAAAEEPRIVSYSVNSGKALALGTTNAKTYTVSVTAEHAAGIYDVAVDLWHGTDLDNIDGLIFTNEEQATCTASSATRSTCKLTVTVDPKVDLYSNDLAGSWKVTVGAISNDGDLYWNDYHGSTKVQRYSKLTVNAAPEPVTKGKKVTVTGKLTRANWETGDYRGYTVQKTDLQFRKKSQETYPGTLKTVTTNSKGELSTTSTATVDGYWRYYFKGTSTTPAVKATGDYVDVR
ncbi:DUF5707 domain-containing protein [Streptomyces daliensis]|uniref:Calcium-binding protein n=1 Tax=Streptomyces daliensis TaxID=299421 RepID=A0A8T4IYV8_9ACTN|nr:calcium-binding protein [Streptomyces daliensis]